jgi:hypothetical protein
MGRVHHVNLAGLFRMSPIAGFKNCSTRLQEGNAIAMGDQEAKTDQFKCSIPGTLSRRGSRSRAPMND